MNSLIQILEANSNLMIATWKSGVKPPKGSCPFWLQSSTVEESASTRKIKASEFELLDRQNKLQLVREGTFTRYYKLRGV